MVKAVKNEKKIWGCLTHYVYFAICSTHKIKSLLTRIPYSFYQQTLLKNQFLPRHTCINFFLLKYGVLKMGFLLMFVEKLIYK